MFIVTNRAIDESASGLNKLGAKPNGEGPNELRLVEAQKKAGRWGIEILPDTITDKMKREAGIKDAGPVFASRYVARRLLGQVRSEKRNFLFFVHGYNNDFEAMLDRADGFAKQYGVEVVAFSWPANGGGAHGVASYKSDKRDARASVGALDRALAKIADYLNDFNAERHRAIAIGALKKFPDNCEARDEYITEMTEEGCPFTVNMALHSMGNYLYKETLMSSVYRGKNLLFDNVVMVAADTNNEGHEQWVDQIRCRRRIYITINEDDAALMASRMKAGEEQKARLGHYPYNLRSGQAVYVDFTSAPWVQKSHAYFEGAPLRNKTVSGFFEKAFNGARAEEDLAYDAARGLYTMRR
ncbi:MAG: Uncharacterized protein FD165_2600 [Gammaproteobacteria bacterium]|nr:MAG: Uncharacterized protein FD165_2600 [Gammaproteobacteria bacterium]TND01491.1 MAG: Uncharacterized protein FD120_2561 [Gammaproteobacteria bacterium]